MLYALLIVGVFGACRSVKYVPEGEFLLDKVSVESVDKEVNTDHLSGYLRQNPNARWFSLVKVPLSMYSLSGKDSSRWINRMLRRIGEPPVIYERELADRSCEDIRQALQNMGYMGATATVDELYKKHKVRLTYMVNPGERYRISAINKVVSDSVVGRLLQRVESQSFLYKGMALDINRLDDERKRISDYLQNQGYYKFTKEYVTFTADTVKGTREAALTMFIAPLDISDAGDTLLHQPYRIDNINVVTEFDLGYTNASRLEQLKMKQYRDLNIYYKDYLPLRPKVFAENLFFRTDSLFRARTLQRTYSALSRLQALKYTNIHFVEKQDSVSGKPLLDCFVLTAPDRIQGFSFEVEGTNTAGDFGAAASLSYQHKNLFHGSETFTFKLRGAYEAISGLQGYVNENYIEYGAEATLNFPRFMFPFLSSQFKRRIRAVSELGLRYNTQERPEFSRRVASASWSYRWTQRQKVQHKIDLIDINYVYMSSISSTFRDEYLNNVAHNSILKYNYEDLFIARMGYTYSYSSLGLNGLGDRNRNHFSLRVNAESAGNLLNVISHTLYERKTADGQYALGNIAYAQYLKGDFEFTQNIVIDYRNSLVLHFGLGIAYPYGNSTILPFEKRYFSGGANSVRGWSVRELGPGSFSGGDRKIDFINQSGDLKLDLNLEYRTLLFWKINGAFFVDAGNIWTLRNYPEQPGGAFRFHSFLHEIAVAWGIGLRFNFDYFILRFDGGMKAINPAYPSDSPDHYPILHPDFNRDFSFHFAVGYPF